MSYKNPSMQVLWAALLGLGLFLAGCTTPPPAPSPSAASLMDASKVAGNYLRLSAESTGLSALDYKLKALELLLQFGHTQEAQRVLKGMHLESILDPAVRRAILSTRLALLKNEPEEAQLLLQRIRDTLESSKKGETAALIAQPSTVEDTLQNARIALLLPSKGPHAALAKIIQDGFLAGYYLHKNPKAGTTAQGTLKVYPTGSGDKLQHAYQQALAEEADIIVGPLTKTEVQSIAGLSLKVPVLALNTVQTRQAPPAQLYQFGLIPENEARVVSAHAYQQGHRRALVLYVDSEWGQRLANAFKEDWQQRGASLTASQSFDTTKDLDGKLQSLLKIKDQRRRTDADLIFIAANVEQARALKPLLNFYDAETLPLYGTSSVYSGLHNPEQDQVLNGLHFCDMPWVLQHSHALQEAHQSIEKVWLQSANDSPRFFALGLDAYKIAHGLLAGPWPQAGFEAFTGKLTLDADRHIQRNLVCATFKKGIPVVDP